jgi:RNA polymerase sigma factor (sigma-70 family)
MTKAASALSALVRGAEVGRCMADASDAELLARFVSDGDGEAFAALVHRHGPLVLAICRRVSGDVHLADDAFQAAFLVLARRASDVKPGHALRGWLYGVAVRTAKEARRMASRRRSRETHVASLPERVAPSDEPPDSDALRILDEEIGQLPEHYRAAVILFEIDGLSRREAAARLGIPEGTLASRLAKARKVLTARLQSRGVVCPAVGALTVLGAGAQMSSALANAAVRMSAPGPIPAHVAELARGACQTMFLKTILSIAVATAAAVAGLTTLVGATQEPPAVPAKKAPANEPQAAKPASPNRIFFTTDNDVVSINPDGKDERKLKVPENAQFWAVPSPDGRLVAYVEESADAKASPQLCIAEVGGTAKPSRYELPAKIGFLEFSWSPDGRTILACSGMEGQKGVQHYRLDVPGRKFSRLDILKTRTVDGWSADGKSLVTTEVGDGNVWAPKSVHLTDLDGKEKQLLATSDKWVGMGRLSPDGKRLLVTHEGGLAVVDVSKPENLMPVEGSPEHIERGEYDWSPDGKRIVFRRQKGTLQEPGDVELVVADPDGKNATVIKTFKPQGCWKVYWR